MEEVFGGFRPEAYIFLTELGFNNNRTWVERNRQRYRELLQRPLRDMAGLLLPDMLDIDPDFNTRPGCIVSRLNRDTRFSRNKLPYRDHLWLGFRREGLTLGESLCMYFEISPRGYTCGLGMYCANLPLMNGLRTHALADPEGFGRLIADPALRRYALSGSEYRRDRVPGAPAEFKPYLNRRSLGLYRENPSLAPTMSPGILGEVRGAMKELGPMYRYILDMD